MLPDIRDLLNSDQMEWERMELKAGFDPDDVVKNICAFANDLNGWGGGYLVLGCAEKDQLPDLPPVGLPANKISGYQKQMRAICNQIDPYYWPIMKPCLYDNRHLLVLWVPVGDRRPYTAPETQAKGAQRVYFIRQGSETRRPNATEQARLLEQAARIKFDSVVRRDAPLTAVNKDLILQYLRETKSILVDDAEQMSLEELCHSLMIAKKVPDDDVRPLNVALLLFTEKPELYFPGAVVEIVFFSDEEGTHIFEERVFNGPLNKQLTDILSFFLERVIASKEISAKPQSRMIQNYPFGAIREAVVNAVYHRSYEVSSKVEIAIYPNRIHILSFDGPPAVVTEATLVQERQDVHDYRNPVLGAFLKDFGLAEKRATGLKRIRKELAINGSEPPAFDIGSQRTHFLVVLRQHPDWEDSSLSFDNPPSDDIVAEAKVTQEDQVILERGLEGATVQELKAAFGGVVSNEELVEWINTLVEKKYLTKKTLSRESELFTMEVYLTTTLGEKVFKQSF